MRKYIFLIPLLTVILASCGSGSSGQGSAEPDQEYGAPVEVPSAPPEVSAPETAMGKRLSSLGFQTPTADLPAVDFSLKDLSGQEQNLSSYAGKLVFLNFWATWCGPCRAEIPSMEELYLELQNQDFVIVALNSQEADKQVADFVENVGMSFPVLLDTAGRVGAAYSIRAIPTTYIIDPQGYILGRMVGTRDWYTPEIISLVGDLLP
jgi:thiol-disulfide isomerase/thioredoxin